MEEDVGTCSYLKKTFSFVDEPSIYAGCSCPGMNSKLEEDLEFLKSNGISAIISLNESGIDEQVVKRFGIRHLQLHVADYKPPSLKDLEVLENFLRDGEKTVVHCNAGMGRTGTVLACIMVLKYDLSAEDAIKLLRGKRKGSIQTFKQEDGVREFEKLSKKGKTTNN